MCKLHHVKPGCLPTNLGEWNNGTSPTSNNDIMEICVSTPINGLINGPRNDLQEVPEHGKSSHMLTGNFCNI